MTGEELGAALGLSRSQISKIEHGTRRPDVSEIAEIADVFEVTLAEVLGVERSGSLALAARVMTAPAADGTLPARRRMRQLLEAEASLAAATGLRASRLTASGRDVLAVIRDQGFTAGSVPWQDGEDLADTVRQGLGLGRAPVADIAELAEQHFGIDVLAWPTGTAVSGLCAHGEGVAMMVVSTGFPRGHQRFTAAHELAHHLLLDPREIVIDADLYASTPAEKRANAFAAALLMPADGLRDVVAGGPLDETVLSRLMRHFGVSYSALVYRLAGSSVGLLTARARDAWLAEPVQIPPRLWRAAQAGYQTGRIGIGTLAALADEDAEQLFVRLAADGVHPPLPTDDLRDL